MSLQADGLMPIVCPVADDSDIAGIGIFAAHVDEVRRIMDGDPGVQSQVFTYELHPCQSFPRLGAPAGLTLRSRGPAGGEKNLAAS